MTARIELVEDACSELCPPSARPHHVRLVVGGEITLTSEAYANRANARRAARAHNRDLKVPLPIVLVPKDGA